MKHCKHWKQHVAFLMVFLMALTSFGPNTETLYAATKQVKSISLKIDSKNVTKKKVTLYCGDKKELKVTVSPKGSKKKVTFSSSNKKVASVSSKGVIKAKKAGKTKIKVTVAGQNKKTTYVNIKVKNVSLSLSKKTASLEVGKSLTLQAKVSPKKKVKWSSSNTGVATVSSKGVVKAKKAGTAKITAYVGIKKAICKVTVKEADKKDINWKARKAFYDVMVNGVAPGGHYGETSLGILRKIVAGTYPVDDSFLFLFKDIDGDGIKELLFLDAQGEFKNVDDYDGDEGIIKITLALKYKETRVEAIFFDEMEYSNGEFLLNNNKVVNIGRISTYNSNWMPDGSSFKNIADEIYLGGRSFTVCDDWDAFSNGQEDNGKKEYSFIKYTNMETYADLGTEYFINEQLVSREEWRQGIQTDIIDNLIPQDQFYKVSPENFQNIFLQ